MNRWLMDAAKVREIHRSDAHCRASASAFVWKSNQQESKLSRVDGEEEEESDERATMEMIFEGFEVAEQRFEQTLNNWGNFYWPPRRSAEGRKREEVEDRGRLDKWTSGSCLDDVRPISWICLPALFFGRKTSKAGQQERENLNLIWMSKKRTVGVKNELDRGCQSWKSWTESCPTDMIRFSERIAFVRREEKDFSVDLQLCWLPFYDENCKSIKLVPSWPNQLLFGVLLASSLIRSARRWCTTIARKRLQNVLQSRMLVEACRRDKSQERQAPKKTKRRETSCEDTRAINCLG